MKKVLKNVKGITLIALVITIIVLLILAGVSISMISSQDGILTKAKDAKYAMEIKTEEEMVQLAVNNAYIEEEGNFEKETAEEEIKKSLVENGLSITEDNFKKVNEKWYYESSLGKKYAIDKDANVSIVEELPKIEGFVDGILYYNGEPFSGDWWYNSEDKIENPSYELIINGKFAKYQEGKIYEGWSIDNLYYMFGNLYTGIVKLNGGWYSGSLVNDEMELLDPGGSYEKNSLIVNNGKRFDGISYMAGYRSSMYSEVINGLLQETLYSCLLPTTEIEVIEEDEKGRKKRRKKKIKDIKEGDKVLSVNPETGKLEEDVVIYADGDENKKYNKFEIWTFNDGTEVKTVHKHRFYNIERQDFVYIQEWNIGEHGYKESGEIIELIGHKVVNEEVQHCTIFTEKWNNYFANGVLTGNRNSIKMKIL